MSPRDKVALPAFSRLKQLGKLLRIPTSQVTKDLTNKHRRKLYCKFDEGWFQFKSATEVIVPYSTAAAYAQIQGRTPTLRPLEPRPLETRKRRPAVAMIGHFNHGKTSLLDALGGTSIVDTELHGITQVVRTRPVPLSEDVEATFVDTPGQDIFYRMRNYGAAVADAVVLVVAADEGICEQSMECIGIVESLRLPVLVCVNKVDHAVVRDPLLERLEQQLREYVALDGAPIVRVSATQRINLDGLRSELLRLLSSVPHLDLQSEATQGALVAEGDRGLTASGTVLNLWRDRSCGTVLHVLLASGELRLQAVFSAGGWCGVVKRITLDDGAAAETAAAGQGVRIGVKMIYEHEPRPLGDSVLFLEQDEAYQLSEQRHMQASFGDFLLARDALLKYGLPAGATDEQDQAQEEQEEQEEVGTDDDEEEDTAVVLKTDSDITLGTLLDALEEAEERWRGGEGERPLRISRSGVGEVTTTDALVARASSGVIVSYGVAVARDAAREIQSQSLSLVVFDKLQDAVELLVGKVPLSQAPTSLKPRVKNNMKDC